MADLFTKVQEKVAGKDVKIVFPEGLDERILVAVNNLAGNKVLKPIVVGNKEDIQAKAKELNLTLDGVDIFDPHTYEGMEELVQAFVERRKGKATEEQAQSFAGRKLFRHDACVQRSRRRTCQRSCTFYSRYGAPCTANH